MRSRSPGRLLVLALLTAGCGGEEPAAMRVGELAFGAAGLEAIPASEHAALADVAAWAQAVRDGKDDSLLIRIADRAGQRSRLNTLSLVLGARALGLTEDDLRRAYEAAPEWELEVRHIIRMADGSAPMEARIAALEAAEEVLRRARAGESFSALAAEFSEEPGAAERGGRLQPGRRGSWVDPFWEAAESLQPGELSGVVETEYGFHVLRLDARRPVPFAEADRERLLRRLVPQSAATEAMAAWAADAPEVRLEAAGVETARSALLEGVRLPDVTIARAGERSYTGADLAVSWTVTSAEERRNLLQPSSGNLRGWLEADAREAFWAAEAARLGAPAQEQATRDELSRWRASAGRWSTTLGLAPELTSNRLREAVFAAVLARGQEFRIARQEMEALRPLLRAAYPVVVPGASAAASSSEIRKSARTG